MVFNKILPWRRSSSKSKTKVIDGSSYMTGSEEQFDQVCHAKQCSPMADSEVQEPRSPHAPDHSEMEQTLDNGRSQSRRLSTYSECSTDLSEESDSDCDSDFSSFSPRPKRVSTVTSISLVSSVSSVSSTLSRLAKPWESDRAKRTAAIADNAIMEAEKQLARKHGLDFEDSDSEFCSVSPRQRRPSTSSSGSRRPSISSVSSKRSILSSTSQGSRRSSGSLASSSSIALSLEDDEDMPGVEDRDNWFSYWDSCEHGGDGSQRLTHRQVVVALSKTFPAWDRSTIKEIVGNMWLSFDVHGFGSLGKEEMMKPQLGFVDSVHSQLMWMR